MGEHIVDHHTQKAKDNMQNLEESLNHLIDQMMFITRHQTYQRVNMHCPVIFVNRTPSFDRMRIQFTHNRQIRVKGRRNSAF